MSSETRDARRWMAYERLLTDPAAAPSERAQAKEQIETLKARYPGGRPAVPRRETTERWSTGHRSYTHASWREPPDPSQREADAAAARARRVKAVEQQRAMVERVPDWKTSTILRDLHASQAEWSEEEQWCFKDQRVRLTGSSRASDL